jgi:hypothetical protein
MIPRRLTHLAVRTLRWRYVLPVLALLWGMYLVVLHPWLMAWGATPQEQQASLPGDQLATGPVTYFTRAVTIKAPAEAVWPWLVQIGQDRAGFYSNTWLENLTGSNIHNTSQIHPEWQPRAIGDQVPMARPDLLGGLGGFVAQASHTDIFVLEQPRVIANDPGRFVLEAVDGHTTRLLLRESIQPDAGLHSAGQGPAATRWLLWDPMHFVMVQRMLRGIKERAEGQPLVAPALMTAARMGWILAGVSIVGVFLARRRFRPWLLLPALLVLPALSSTGDWDAALAGFLAIGITILGALAFGRRWWPAYTLLASAVFLTLLLAPDPYSAFGLVFAPILLVAAGVQLSMISRHASAEPRGAGIMTARSDSHT